MIRFQRLRLLDNTVGFRSSFYTKVNDELFDQLQLFGDRGGVSGGCGCGNGRGGCGNFQVEDNF